jgi:ubiquinone/menaquinone biosynthesis C-methylase UbiE
MSRSQDEIVRSYFVDKGSLFRIVMDSKHMLYRAKKIAKGVAKQLMFMGVDRGYILDIGCGTGRIALELADIGYHVVGIDISRQYVEEAIRRAEERGLSDKVKFIVCDARDIVSCLKGMEFDAVIFVWSSVIGYYDEDTDVRILSQVKNVVKDSSALFLIDFVNKEHIMMEFMVTGVKTYAYDYGNYVVLENTLFNPITSEVLIKQVFYRKEGRDLVYLDESYFKMRVYSLNELVQLARRSGWCLSRVLKEIGGEPGYNPLGPLNLVFTPCKQ